ncbi:hypothetical protein IFM89_017917 [Coptis chinensis]|uniref:Uncharacterized protein n=1 Tax=Coptis chinensis TaxID=261450 RepID=A0A835LW99_9MAGN|nr:hypothetical protein IFM89_017917 [Coptis chinensis]
MNTAAKPTEHTCKVIEGTTPLIRHQRKRRNWKTNKNGPHEASGVSGANDTQGTPIEEQEQGEIFQDSTSELEETIHLTDIIEAQELMVTPTTTIHSPGIHRTGGVTRISREVENTVHQVIVYDQSKEQADGISNEGEHTRCAIMCTEMSPNLQIVVVIENEPIASLQSPKNTFKVLNEANSLLASTNWADMAEEEEETGKNGHEEEWKTQKKKTTKSKWMEQKFLPPSTRARLASKSHQ